MERAEAIRKIEYALEMETSEPTPFGQLTVVRTDALKIAYAALRDQDKLARNLQHRASYEQVTEALRPNGFRVSGAVLASKNQVKKGCEVCSHGKYLTAIFTDQNGRDRLMLFKFCPNCGRKMPEV